MSKKSKKQRAKARKAQVRRESGITLRAVTPPPSTGAKILELEPAKRRPQPAAPKPEPASAPAEEQRAPERSEGAADGSERVAEASERVAEASEGAADGSEGVAEASEPDGARRDAIVPASLGHGPAAAEKTAAPEAKDAAGAGPIGEREDGGRSVRGAPEEHRASPRVSVAVDIHLASDSHFFSGLSGDISEGGLFLSTYRPLTVGTQVDVEFSLPGTDRPVHARGEVRWIREHSADQPRGVGIAFEDLSDEDREEIHAFCSSRPPLYYEDVG